MKRLHLVAATQAAAVPEELRPYGHMVAGELRFEIFGEFLDIIGSKAQLEAEGLSPPDGQWPERDRRFEWQSGQLELSVRRQRPRDFKGPKREWLALDHWSVRVNVVGRDFWWYQQQSIERKRQDLHRMQYGWSQAEIAAGQVIRDGWIRAQRDRGFQAFKAALLPPRRVGRKPGGLQQAQRGQVGGAA